ncbi:MAG: hypothetical protein WBX09_15390 [Terracidiphilus sp.]
MTSAGLRFLRSAAFLSVAFIPVTCGSRRPSLEKVLTITETSAHYIYHYSPGDHVDSASVEAFYDWMSAQLHVEYGRKIHFYKFTDEREKELLTGRGGNADSDPGKGALYTIWPTDSHETTHLLTSMIGIPTPFLNEGFAVANQADPLDHRYTARWNGYSPHHWAKQFLQAGSVPALEHLLYRSTFERSDASIAYPVAGSFVLFLIEKHGLPKVLQMFPGARFSDSPAVTMSRFSQVFGQPFGEAENNWRAFLAGYNDPVVTAQK